jgi:hypothetical protein
MYEKIYWKKLLHMIMKISKVSQQFGDPEELIV